MNDDHLSDAIDPMVRIDPYLRVDPIARVDPIFRLESRFLFRDELLDSFAERHGHGHFDWDDED